MAEAGRILVYGDSLTWGWTPVETVVPTTRYPRGTHWTDVLVEAVGPDVEVVVDALSGRTTDADDPLDPRLNGAAHLPTALAAHLPLDLVVILLGTNDTKVYFGREPFDIAAGALKLLGLVAASAGGVGTAYPAPPALLVAPPPLGEVTELFHAELFRGGQAKSAALAPLYAAVAKLAGADFLNLGEFLSTDGVDGIHFTPENNQAAGRAISGRVVELLGVAKP
jgi:lysophospholipase L1-like esterase